MNRFAKFYASLTVGLMSWGTAVVASPSGPITSTEWMVLAGVGVASVAVWFVPNT